MCAYFRAMLIFIKYANGVCVPKVHVRLGVAVKTELSCLMLMIKEVNMMVIGNNFILPIRIRRVGHAKPKARHRVEHLSGI